MVKSGHMIAGHIWSSQDKISVIQRDWPKDNHEDGYCDVIGKQQDWAQVSSLPGDYIIYFV